MKPEKDDKLGQGRGPLKAEVRVQIPVGAFRIFAGKRGFEKG